MNDLIKESKLAMESVKATLIFANIDLNGLSVDDAINKARSITAPCHHQFKSGNGVRQCTKCGSLQS